MIDAYLRERQVTEFDFRQFASPEDPLRHLFDEWVEYYRSKFAICRAIAPRSILEIGVRYGYSAITFLEASPGAEYLGLDLDSGEYGGNRGAIEWARRITSDHRARVEIADTQSLASLPGDGYDLVHVDGQQDGDGTYHDLELALEKARWILVDGIFWSRSNLEASTAFLEKYHSLVEYAVMLPGYAGDLVIRVRDGASFHRTANSIRDHRAIKDEYTRDYFLNDCGGYQAFKAGSGRKLGDVRLTTLFELGRPWAGMRVLDVGSGRGELAYACFEAGAEVSGLDYSSAAIEIARETYRDAIGPRLQFVCEDLLDLRPAAPYDRILMADVVEHIAPAQLDQAFAILRNHLSPDGRVIVHTWPNRLAYNHQHAQRRRAARAIGIFVPRNQRSLYEDRMHLNEQTPAGLRRGLRRHFGEVVAWAGNLEDPAAGLRAPPSRAQLLSDDSIFAVAAHGNVDRGTLLAALTQEALDPDSLEEIRIAAARPPGPLPAGEGFELPLSVRNASSHRLASLQPFPVNISYHWLQAGRPVVFDGQRTRLGAPLEPRESRKMVLQAIAPPAHGTYDLAVTLVQEGRFWLGDSHPQTGTVLAGITVY